MIVVADSGPLISLASINHFDLLKSLYHQINIPLAVQNEVVNIQGGLPGSKQVAAASWVLPVEVRDNTAVQILRERLDLGESQAIVLAIELKADVLLIDEARGRRVAEARGLNKTGTIGTLIMAKKRGLIPSVSPLLDELIAKGFRMSQELYQTARQIANEG